MEWINSIWIIVYNYLINDEILETVGRSALKIILIIIFSSIIIRIGKKIIRNIFTLRTKGPVQLSARRQATLVKLLENVLTYVIYFIVLLMVFETFGVDIRALLAGAGIVGLAVGFGAQNLVRDIITGFFIIFEDQFSVGDYIRIGNNEGVVEEIGLRTTKIKGITGELHIYPNGNILEVTNFSIHNSIAIVDINVAYEENIIEVETAIEELLKVLPEKYPEMVATPTLLGVQNIAAPDITMRITAEVQPMQHWKIGRALRKEIKMLLDQKGIDIAYPRMVMYSRNEKQEVRDKG
ncbi:mechanosensitive ion channel family protein [Bacillus sp. Marseille-P3661]|uniref:mechanosensitive ion channel family protein n=1 Tax=Bacillus sp. Marseille-P3661 TaxID=1936234 RepID=UPI000C827A11|nr:mechanosensitive ion channel family protein [Bacillus sp. Marseille-P3661]